MAPFRRQNIAPGSAAEKVQQRANSTSLQKIRKKITESAGLLVCAVALILDA